MQVEPSRVDPIRSTEMTHAAVVACNTLYLRKFECATDSS